MTECGHYRVVDKRDYRGHKQGTEFLARLEPRAEYRAIQRGSIERLGTVTPQPGHHIFPEGWLQPDTDTDHRGRESGLSH